jgi:hypothetical protein
LVDLGYDEGRNLAVEYRFGDDNIESVPELAAGLVRLPVEIILAQGAAVAVIAKLRLPVPVVYVFSGDPVSAGFGMHLLLVVRLPATATFNATPIWVKNSAHVEGLHDQRGPCPGPGEPDCRAAQRPCQMAGAGFTAVRAARACSSCQLGARGTNNLKEIFREIQVRLHASKTVPMAVDRIAELLPIRFCRSHEDPEPP